MTQAIILVGLIALLFGLYYFYYGRRPKALPPVPPPPSPTFVAPDEEVKVAKNREERQKRAQTTAAEFSKAVQDLESEELNTRLGAMYVLESISRHSTDLYHWPVMQAFCAYFQQRFPQEALTEDNFPIDLETVYKMIGQRLVSYEKRIKGEAIDEQKRIYLKDLDFTSISLKAFNFRGCRLDYFILSECDLRDKDFFGTNLKGVLFKQANLTRSNFIGAIIRDCDFSEANLSQAEFIMARLSSVNLQKANLKGANLRQADLNGSNFKGANLEQVIDLTLEQLKTAIIDEHTVLPANLMKHRDELLRIKEKAE